MKLGFQVISQKIQKQGSRWLELSQKSGHQICPGHLNDLDHQTAAASAASRALALATPPTHRGDVRLGRKAT